MALRTDPGLGWLMAVSVPVMIIAIGLIMRQMIPQFRDARMVTIPKAKLLPQEERPAEVVRAVVEFLAG